MTAENTGTIEEAFISYNDWHARKKLPKDAHNWLPVEPMSRRLDIEPRVIGYVPPNWPELSLSQT